MQPSQQLLTREGPSEREIRIIGVELAIRPSRPNGQGREVELEMFACSHTLPAPPYGSRHELRVTLHTSDGDLSLFGLLGR